MNAAGFSAAKTPANPACSNASVCALICAGGKGTRAGFNKNKLLKDVLGIPVLERTMAAFAAAGADGITVHVESTHHLHRVLQQIRALGKRPGVVLNPATPLTELEYVLDDVEMVLIMSVNPGFGGQKLIESSYRKVADLRDMCVRRGLDDMLIEVDGGVNAQTAPKLIEAGANVLVAGSALFGASDPAAVVKALRQEN